VTQVAYNTGNCDTGVRVSPVVRSHVIHVRLRLRWQLPVRGDAEPRSEPTNIGH
jgi:hypothetical protein